MHPNFRNRNKRPEKRKRGFFERNKGNNFFRIITLLIVFLVLNVIFKGTGTNSDIKEPSINELVQSVKNEEVKSITEAGKKITVVYADESEGKLRKDSIESFSQTLFNFGLTAKDVSSVEYRIVEETGFGIWFLRILPFLFPILIISIFLWFMFGQKGAGGVQVFNFGKSKAKFIDPNNKEKRVLFSDVAGDEEAKQELQEFVDFLRKPEKFLEIGAKIPRGVLLNGPPGTGKTLLARAVAGEARVPFYSISGSEFVEMFVGVGASRVRDLFDTAKKTAPAIIFIDEIDAIGRTRGSGLGGGNDEREQALNQMLVEMDGFDKESKVVVLASTNRPDVLDVALLRPGRFDRKVIINLPDIKARNKILDIHIKDKKVSDSINLEAVARRTPGFSGADLESVINEAGIAAVRHDRKEILQKDLLEAIEKVILGPEKKSKNVTQRERELIAYHEAGHALLSSILAFAAPVQKITIVPRGFAGGYVLNVPDTEISIISKKQLLDDITVLLGGYVTEKIIFGEVSTGPSNDLEKVSALAEDMVTRFGMSDAFGPLPVKTRKQNMYGVEEHSEKYQSMVDEEVNKIINSCLKKAEKLLKENKNILEVIVKELYRVETLEREEYEELLKNHNVKILNHTAPENNKPIIKIIGTQEQKESKKEIESKRSKEIKGENIEITKKKTPPQK